MDKIDTITAFAYILAVASNVILFGIVFRVFFDNWGK